MSQISEVEQMRQLLDGLQSQLEQLRTEGSADDATIASLESQVAKLRSDGEWRETSRQSYIRAHNAAVKKLGLPLPSPNGGAYTVDEILAVQTPSDQSAEVAKLQADVARLESEQTQADEQQAKLKKAMTDKGIKLPS